MSGSVAVIVVLIMGGISAQVVDEKSRMKGTSGAVFISRFEMFTAEAHALVAAASKFPKPVLIDYGRLDSLVGNLSQDLSNIKQYYEAEAQRVAKDGYFITGTFTTHASQYGGAIDRKYIMASLTCEQQETESLNQATVQELKEVKREIKEEATLANLLLEPTKAEARSFEIDLPELKVSRVGPDMVRTEPNVVLHGFL